MQEEKISVQPGKSKAAELQSVYENNVWITLWWVRYVLRSNSQFHLSDMSDCIPWPKKKKKMNKTGNTDLFSVADYQFRVTLPLSWSTRCTRQDCTLAHEKLHTDN